MIEENVRVVEQVQELVYVRDQLGQKEWKSIKLLIISVLVNLFVIICIYLCRLDINIPKNTIVGGLTKLSKL